MRSGRGERKRGFGSGLAVLLASLLVLTGWHPVAQAARARERKIVFIAGKKSHGPGDHEYEKGCRLLARCLETAPNLKGYRTEVCLNGWPEDPRTLDDADAIVLYCDGSDHSEADHPLLQGDRLATLARQMRRGAGLVVLHYTVFVPQKRGGPEFLDWVGGYFDYETGDAANHWYSKIQTAATTATPASPAHPVSRGLAPFPLREEYYYHMRFREPDPRRVPILTTELPGETGPQTVAWAVQRADGGRGFAYTGGHFHSNWSVEGLRRMVLNGIVWAARGEVPAGGVQSALPEAERPIRTLILTGHQHPAHDWRATTEALNGVLGRDPRFRLDVWEDPERLATGDVSAYDLLVLNYQNYETASLSAPARERLLTAVRGGKGLLIVHFANGTWLDWPEYRFLARRVWIDGVSSHDAYGPFRVEIPHPDHPLTRGLAPFTTTDELYTSQQGMLPIEPLLTARSKVTGKEEPLAFAYAEGKGRIFQSLLGHDAAALRTPQVAEVFRRAGAWAAGRAIVALPPEPQAQRVVPGHFGGALSPAGGTVSAESKPAYQNPPLTVECWTRLTGKAGFNILVASSPKQSSTHWELYTTAGTGAFSVYLPGVAPAVLDSGAPLVDEKWHYVGMAYAPGQVRLFVDGKQVLERALAPAAGKPVSGPVWFGSYPPQGIGCEGAVDEVRISSTLRDLTHIPDAPLTPDSATLGLWRFDTEENGQFADLSSQKNPAIDETQGLGDTGTEGPDDQTTRRPDHLTTTTHHSPLTTHFTDWPVVGNDPGGMRYSPLKQINRRNVRELKVAWVYHTGDAEPGSSSTLECTPLVIDGVMYLTTVKIRVVALDAATGRELWKYDPGTGGVNRGLAYWKDPKSGARRLLLGTPNGKLISLDARTGRPDPAFGKNGGVDLRAGITERDISRMNYGATSAPAVFENLVIVPITNTESQPGAPGDIRAFDIRTGKQVWRFHTVPEPGEAGHETWEGDSWRERSGVNAWSGYTVDAKRGILFCGLGSAASDFYGADRHGQNLFANSTLALDARTGERLWHFQTLHHDLWDHDLPCPPVLVTVRRHGRKIDATAQPTKTGVLFLFDRVTGEPLFPVEERAVPASDVPGERAWPTQPFPLKPPPFSRQSIGEADLTDLSPEAHASALAQFRKHRSGPIHTPPTVAGTITIPGFHGGANWSGASFDPTTGLLYVNSNNVPNVTTLTAPKNPLPGRYDFTGYFRFLDPNGYPAIKPPWGNLTAIDLNRGEFRWQIVFGEYPELRAKGLPPTGTENFGGTIVTAGGLVFIGGTKDEKFHAYDKSTGQLLWDYQLPAGGYATPCTYSVNGRQYVAIAAGGGGKLTTKSGDAYVVFALPK